MMMKSLINNTRNLKPYIAVVAIFLCAVCSHAQTSTVDSRTGAGSNSIADTVRIKQALRNISNINSIDSAIILVKRLIEESKQINYKTGEAEARQILAAKYNMKGEYQQAAENLAIAENMYASLKDSLGLNYVWSTYGMMYGMQSKYDTSIRYFEAAIGVAERNGYDEELSGDYGNIAIGYQMQSNFGGALRYQQKAYTLAKTRNDTDDLAYATLNMGLTYFAMGDNVRAEQSYIESVSFAKKIDEKAVELYAYTNLADLFLKENQPQKAYDFAMKAAVLGNEMGDQGIKAASLSKASLSLASMNNFPEAERLAGQAITVADSSGQPFNIYQAYSAMGSLLKRMENYKKAIPYFEKGITALAGSDIYDEDVGHTNHDLSLCYEKTGDFHHALISYKTGSQILDSVRSRENIRKATELSMNYEYEKKQEAQRILQKQKDANAKERQLALLIGLGLTLILAIVALMAFRMKQRANSVLKHQKQEIEQTLSRLEATQKQLIQAEKMASLGELTAGIAHEIQNPLNFVNNFSEVNRELIEELKLEKSKASSERDEQLELDILNDISSNEQKINHHGKRADAIVKGMLQHSRGGSGQKEPTDINTLADEYLRLAYHGLRAKDKSFNAKFETDFDESIGKINVMQQDFGRVILNLINNAFYAVSEKQRLNIPGYEPIVTLSTKKSNSAVEIIVKDNGNGIPPKVLDKIFQPFYTTKPTGQGTGLGLSLSYDIVKAHGGNLKVETVHGGTAQQAESEGAGTSFIIQLPYSNQ